MLKVLLIVLSIVVVGCSSSNQNQDLKDFIAENKRRPPGKVEAAPKIQVYESYTYDVYSLRGPFDRPVNVDVTPRSVAASSDVKPDLARQKERLEQFDLATLSMVGTVTKSGSVWALVKDPNGSIERIKTGNFMGLNHGKITNLSESKIELVEIVASGEGWLERPNILELQTVEK